MKDCEVEYQNVPEKLNTEGVLRGADRPEEKVFCLDKLTGIRLKDINMTKIENLDYTIS